MVLYGNVYDVSAMELTYISYEFDACDSQSLLVFPNQWHFRTFIQQDLLFFNESQFNSTSDNCYLPVPRTIQGPARTYCGQSQCLIIQPILW